MNYSHILINYTLLKEEVKNKTEVPIIEDMKYKIVNFNSEITSLR